MKFQFRYLIIPDHPNENTVILISDNEKKEDRMYVAFIIDTATNKVIPLVKSLSIYQICLYSLEEFKIRGFETTPQNPRDFEVYNGFDVVPDFENTMKLFQENVGREVEVDYDIDMEETNIIFVAAFKKIYENMFRSVSLEQEK